MSDLARLCGSVIVTGFPGDAPDASVLAALSALAPGGVALFDRNVSSAAATRALVRAVREAIGGASPALACVDQEGGRVARVRFRDPGVPAMMALGAGHDEGLAARAGAALANDCARIGANVDFAPVLDLALDARSTVIGTRSFGDDPERTARLGAALVRGLQAQGVAATAKHFPGHGATALDSHRDLPVVAASREQLARRDLVPFAAAIAAGVRAVMTAHVVVPAYASDVPATLAPEILTGLLRRDLGFTGVCFTDCLQMDAIARGVGSVSGGVRALAAGADALLVSHDLDLALTLRDALAAAVTAGTVPLARLEEAAGRMAALRAACAFGTGDDAPDETDPDAARAIARRAIALVRGRPHLDPARPVTVVSFEGDASDGVANATAERPSLSLALRRRRVRSESMRVSSDPDPETIAVLLDVLRGQGDRALVIVARRAHLHPGQCAAIDALLAHAPGAIVISALEPFDVPALERAAVLACTFGDGPAAIDALADVLLGDARADGVFPVVVSPGAARRILTEAEIDRLVSHGPRSASRTAESAADDAETGGA